MPMQNRRRFLTGLTATGAAGTFGFTQSASAEPPPETMTVRISKFAVPGCEVPQYIAAELLRAEGFSDVRLVEGDTAVDSSIWLARGDVDFDWNYAAMHIGSMNAGVPLTVLAGLHSGCLELITREGINSFIDLRGKKVGVYSLSSSPHILLTLMASYIGLDPNTDIQWITGDEMSPKDLFIEGKIDAFLATPPEPQEIRARKIGHTILDTAFDRPWSQYYCCMLAGNAEYVGKHPVATKRVLRAILKAIDLCATDPKFAVERLASDKIRGRYDLTLDVLRDARYDRWRDFDPEDTMRFYALRLYEAGLSKMSPQQIIADGTDWRFLDEIKREMKT